MRYAALCCATFDANTPQGCAGNGKTAGNGIEILTAKTSIYQIVTNVTPHAEYNETNNSFFKQVEECVVQTYRAGEGMVPGVDPRPPREFYMPTPRRIPVRRLSLIHI